MKKEVNKQKSKFIFKEQGPILEDLVIHITNNILLNKSELDLDFKNKNHIKLSTKGK